MKSVGIRVAEYKKEKKKELIHTVNSKFMK